MSKSHSFSQIAGQIGQRAITLDEGLWLIQQPDLPAIGALADKMRMRLHPAKNVSYVIGRIINTTNVCWCRCDFCQYSRRTQDPDSFTMPPSVVMEKVQQLVESGGNEVLIQGGLNPKLGTSYYEGIFRQISQLYPQVVIHALSPAELMHFSRIDGIPLHDVISRLKDAGLQSVPGAGAEILVDSVRQKISRNKISVDDWINTMREVHRAGLGSTATMMYGHVEQPEHCVEHFHRLRELQEETGGFRAFICWPFQPEETRMSHLTSTGTSDYLRMVAVARIMLHNIPNIQVSILTQGPKVAQISLTYGVNDFGSTMFEENVVSAKGQRYIPAVSDMEQLIQQAGYTAVKRNTFYQTVA